MFPVVHIRAILVFGFIAGILGLRALAGYHTGKLPFDGFGRFALHLVSQTPVVSMGLSVAVECLCVADDDAARVRQEELVYQT